jgi:hypothetical protein
MRSAPLTFLLLILLGSLSLPACQKSNDADDILLNQVGKLIWGGSPAVDGMGIIFEVGETIYGAPGSRDDYNDYFPGDGNEVWIRADIRLTGELTYRGWGARLPEIEFLRMVQL